MKALPLIIWIWPNALKMIRWIYFLGIAYDLFEVLSLDRTPHTIHSVSNSKDLAALVLWEHESSS